MSLRLTEITQWQWDELKYPDILYTDDLIIMSTTHEFLQKCIKKLEQYCITWKLEVNIKNIKIMIFNKQGALVKNKFINKKSNIENASE